MIFSAQSSLLFATETDQIENCDQRFTCFIPKSLFRWKQVAPVSLSRRR